MDERYWTSSLVIKLLGFIGRALIGKRMKVWLLQCVTGIMRTVDAMSEPRD